MRDHIGRAFHAGFSAGVETASHPDSPLAATPSHAPFNPRTLEESGHTLSPAWSAMDLTPEETPHGPCRHCKCTAPSNFNVEKKTVRTLNEGMDFYQFQLKIIKQMYPDSPRILWCLKEKLEAATMSTNWTGGVHSPGIANQGLAHNLGELLDTEVLPMRHIAAVEKDSREIYMSTLWHNTVNT
eukprot:5266148-Karenia_brevis.AAC.1